MLKYFIFVQIFKDLSYLLKNLTMFFLCSRQKWQTHQTSVLESFSEFFEIVYQFKTLVIFYRNCWNRLCFLKATVVIVGGDEMKFWLRLTGQESKVDWLVIGDRLVPITGGHLLLYCARVRERKVSRKNPSRGLLKLS